MGRSSSGTAGVGPDHARLGVWENEGGCLHHSRDAATSHVLRDDSVDTHWVPAALLSDLPDEEATHVDLIGLPICLARSSGAVYALFDECSHGQVALSDGEVEGGVIECWLHGSCFDLITGVPTGPPANVPVPVYPVRIVAGIVEIALPASTKTVSEPARTRSRLA